MKISMVNSLLAEIQPALIAAVVEDVKTHLTRLAATGREIYGYALLPGEFYDIHSVVVATNSEGEIEIPCSDDLYRYYRYSVDEWRNYDQKEFAKTNAILLVANERFKALYTREDGSYQMDECEVAFANGVLDALVDGLDAAKKAGEFGSREKFLVVWIADSDVPIMSESSRRLNSAAVAADFSAEFG
ncbi:DUF4303 domain-containing protein [Pseudoduganella sp. R-34]|uniref:DUF4303 domain-containing protein n=1 Tax=unclassified Pseudoduganella TaxID=2637179 RepID=UPI003CEBA52A